MLTQGPRVEVTELEPGDSFEIGGVTIPTAATDHAPVRPTIGFRLEHDGSVVALVGDTLPCEGVDLARRGVPMSTCRPSSGATWSSRSLTR